MLKINVKNETSRLRAVVLGTAVSNGPTPKLEEAYDPKSLLHIKAGTYPLEKDMVTEMEAVAKVFEKYDVKVFFFYLIYSIWTACYRGNVIAFLGEKKDVRLKQLNFVIGP